MASTPGNGAGHDLHLSFCGKEVKPNHKIEHIMGVADSMAELRERVMATQKLCF